MILRWYWALKHIIIEEFGMFAVENYPLLRSHWSKWLIFYSYSWTHGTWYFLLETNGGILFVKQLKNISFEGDLRLAMFILGGSSHLVSGLVHPNYKWINPTYPMSITGVIPHLRFLGWATKYRWQIPLKVYHWRCFFERHTDRQKTKDSLIPTFGGS